MKIGFFSDSYKPYMSGVVKSIELFTSKLREKGHEVYIFAPDYPDAEDNENIFRFKSIPALTNRDFRIALPLSLNIVQEVKEIGLDIIHSHSPFLMGWLARYVAYRLNIPLVFTYHTLYEEYVHYAPLGRKLARRLAIKYSKDYCQSCDQIITPSRFVEEKLRSYNITTPLKTISTGIDMGPYQERNGLTIRERYDIEDDEKVLLFVGRLGQEKNVSFLIKAFKIVNDSLPNTRLLIVGDGPERGKLEEMGRNLNLGQKVIFAGFQKPEQVVDFYLTSDLFVFPSMTETQGLVTLEAMAGGLPVVAVNAAGSTSMVDDGLNGMLTKPDIHHFSRAIIELVTHKKRYHLFMKNSLKKAEEYSIDNMADKLIELYEELLYNKQKYSKSLA